MIQSKNPKRVLILVMSTLVLISFIAAGLYYRYDNKAIDPRIVKARELYEKYDTYAQSKDFNKILKLMDSIELIYQSVPHYENSFEVGVVHNNRSAVYLSMALYYESNSISLDGVTPLSKDSLLSMGEIAANQSIVNYESWLKSYSSKSEEEISKFLRKDFLAGLEEQSESMQERYIAKRTEEILKAQYETQRRLSVAYTNLGIVKRHQENYEGAITCYKKATELWDQNLTAENNLNTLLGQPLKKRSVIEKIFPPDKSN